MSKLVSQLEIEKFNKDGAVFLKNKFDIKWIEKLKKGIEKDIKNPSPRFKSHTTKSNVPVIRLAQFVNRPNPLIKYLSYNSQSIHATLFAKRNVG